jgi:hypothetical protein
MVIDKREARKAFKSRKTPNGVFAVRCAVSGEVWVGASDHLDSARNGVWFLLRNGLHHNQRLQAAWNSHGEAAFEYEVLEKFDEDVAPLLLRDLLRERQKHWERELGASVV